MPDYSFAAGLGAGDSLSGDDDGDLGRASLGDNGLSTPRLLLLLLQRPDQTVLDGASFVQSIDLMKSTLARSHFLKPYLCRVDSFQKKEMEIKSE